MSIIEANEALRIDPEAYRAPAQNLAAIIDRLGEPIEANAADVLITELGGELEWDGATLCEVVKERYSARLGRPGADFETEHEAANQAFTTIRAWAEDKQKDYRASTLSVPAEVELVARKRVRAAANSSEMFADLGDALLVGDEAPRLAAVRASEELLGAPHEGMAFGAIAEFVRHARPVEIKAAHAIVANIEQARLDSVLMASILESQRRETLKAKRRAAAREAEAERQRKELEHRNIARGVTKASG